jgi:quinol monooxygenase YgiN
MPVRVIVTVSHPSAEAAEAMLAERVELCRKAEAEEDGCLQYELFHSKMNPTTTVLCELWASRAIYDKHWNLQQEREKAAPRKPPAAPKHGEHPRKVSVEFYEQRVYQNVDGTWMAADPEQRTETVRWIG